MPFEWQRVRLSARPSASQEGHFTIPRRPCAVATVFRSKGCTMVKAQSSSGERDAIDMLMEDHKRVQKLLKDFEKVERDDPDAVRELVETACMDLQIHSMLEEEIFYPAVRSQLADGDGDSQDLLNEAEVEHEAIDELIAKLQELEADDPMYCAHFAVVGEY